MGWFENEVVRQELAKLHPVVVRKELGQVDDKGGWWIDPQGFDGKLFWSRWEVPGMTQIRRDWYSSGAVVDDFGCLVEVCDFHGE